jgi:sucrose phosphorylase
MPPRADSEILDLQVDRFLAAQAIMLSLVGVPGIYFHSLFGSRGWPEGVRETGRHRTINREKLKLDGLQQELADQNSLRSKIYTAYSRLLKARSSTPAFHPHGIQKILDIQPAIFALERISPDRTSRVLCLHNVSGGPVSCSTGYASAEDLFTGQAVPVSDLTLKPYQVLWARVAALVQA